MLEKMVYQESGERLEQMAQVVVVVILAIQAYLGSRETWVIREIKE